MATRKLRFAEHSEDWALEPIAPQALRLTLTCRRCAVAAHRELPADAPPAEHMRAIYAALVHLEQATCRRVYAVAEGTVQMSPNPPY